MGRGGGLRRIQWGALDRGRQQPTIAANLGVPYTAGGRVLAVERFPPLPTGWSSLFHCPPGGLKAAVRRMVHMTPLIRNSAVWWPREPVK